jgi:hypothetical protein
MTSEQQQMVDELCELESGLSGREIDFIDDLASNYEERELSEKQSDWLESIHRRLVK